MRQSLLKLLRVAQAAPTPLTSLLSQYELLSLLCEYLHSADIIHLGATCREHWQYVGHNPVILRRLIAESACDGKGIIAQARVFGYWKAKPENATRQCRGKDAKPCSDCGAMVCNMCRFHLTYPAHGDGPILEAMALLEDWDDYWDEDLHLKGCDEDWDLEEMFIGAAVNDADIREEHVTGKVELIKAIDMLSSKSQTHCENCEPLSVDSPSSREWCTCDVYSRFVRPWRCISCVLAEETHLVVSQQKYTMTYDPNETRRKDWAYDREVLCKCGKPTVDEPIDTCRWCGKVTGYYASRDAYLLKRIQQQLGSWVDLDRSNNPVLSQLG